MGRDYYAQILYGMIFDPVELWGKHWNDNEANIVDIYYNTKHPVEITYCPAGDDSRLYIYIQESVVTAYEYEDKGIKEFDLVQKPEWDDILREYCRKHLIVPKKFNWILICGGF